MGRRDAWALPDFPFGAQALSSQSAGGVVLALYDTERVALTRYVLVLGLDPEASRDLVHDAFLKLQEHVTAGGDQSQLRAWLYRVAHNLVQNHRRGLRGLPTRRLERPEVSRDTPSADPTPEDVLLSRERDSALSAAMENLTSAQRECLVLRAQGFRYREIAEIVQTSTSTVGEHIQKGIEQLKRQLEKGAVRT